MFNNIGVELYKKPKNSLIFYMINTTYDNDSNDRVGTLIFSPDRSKILIGLAPNHEDDLNQWDLVGKGHIQYGDMKEETVNNEVYEESGLDVKSLQKEFLGSTKYQKGQIYFYAVVLDSMPEKIECKSCFDWHGKQLPEFFKFKWVELKEAEKWLYKGLVKAIFQTDIYEKLNKAIENGII